MTDHGTDEHASDSSTSDEQAGDEQATEGYEGHGEAAAALEEQPPEEKIQEIEKERAERLDPDSRPDNAEIDNTDRELPTVEEFAKMNADDDNAEGSAGTADPTEAFRENPPTEEEVKEIEEERERRLDPENRPENAEVDNTGDNMPDIAKD